VSGDSRRSALIVATYDYDDARLKKLRTPERDAEALARVLGDPNVGNFEVDFSVNEPDALLRRKIGAFFRGRDRADMLLLHFSCHGVKDDDGSLYFATQDTQLEDLDATAIGADFVNRQMTKSRSCRIVLTLDCCYSGAFAKGMAHRADPGMHIGERFDGRGRVVLTASNSMQFAFEDDEVEDDASPSIFTSALVGGLESGEADRDHDSFVTIDELYDYVFERVRDRTPNQTPGKWTYGEEGRFYIARNPLAEPVPQTKPGAGTPEPAQLPADLVADLNSTDTARRFSAVYRLERLLQSRETGISEAARLELEALAEDDSMSVCEAARAALGRRRAGPEPAPEPVEDIGPPPFWPPPPDWIKRKKEADEAASATARLESAQPPLPPPLSRWKSSS